MDIDNFNFWAETYYQSNLANFGAAGLTPYKLKLMLFSNLTADRIATPWNHMTEGLEKSNHRAHRDYQTRTMRNGGMEYHIDPNLLDCIFSFCRCLQLAGVTKKGGPGVYGHIARFKQDVHGQNFDPIPDPSPYLEVCKLTIPIPSIAVGANRPLRHRLDGLRFVVCGNFSKTEPGTQGVVSTWIRELGGKVLENDTALRLVRLRSKTPNCFVIVKNDKDLIKATDGNIALNCLDTRLMLLYKFAVGDFKFVSWEFIRDSRNSECVLGFEDYLIAPECLSRVPKIAVNDIPTLLKHQLAARTNTTTISAFAALRATRRGKPRDPIQLPI